MSITPVKGYPSNYGYMGYLGGRYQEFATDSEYEEAADEEFDEIFQRELAKGGVESEPTTKRNNSLDLYALQQGMLS